MRIKSRFLLLCVAGCLSGTVCAQSLYKYQDENGRWVYTDRRPTNETEIEVRDLSSGPTPVGVRVKTSVVGETIRFTATNDYAAPVEIQLQLVELVNLQMPDTNQTLQWVIPGSTTSRLLDLNTIERNSGPRVEYRYTWLPGDPAARHDDTALYRAPFAVATDYPITQYFPIGVTHLTPDSYYAIDLAMPVGTDIYAARGGLVFEVASTNFSGGLDPERDMQKANIVRVLHDDGSHAVYAHLNTNSIRVQVGERVEKGQFIAESGNTGFSSGPHLHFAVMVNRGMEVVSVPIVFEGPDASAVEPITGNRLFAY